MSYFLEAVDYVLKREGGFVDSPVDPGGATNYGISLRFLREVPAERLRKYGLFKAPDEVDVVDIQHLTQDQAMLIYKGEFWDLVPLEKIDNSDLINYIFDMCVNHGIAEGIKILQRAIWAFYEKREYEDLQIDGILGAHTIEILDTTPVDEFRRSLVSERSGFMRLLVAVNPKERENLNGWLDRCYRFL